MLHSLELYKQKRFNRISEKMIEVDNQITQKVIKKGRTLITCSCHNSSDFAHLNMCRHKTFFLYLPLLEKLNGIIEEKKDFYRGAIILKQKINPEDVLNDLDNILNLK